MPPHVDSQTINRPAPAMPTSPRMNRVYHEPVRNWRVYLLAGLALLFVGWLVYQNTRPVPDFRYDFAKERDTAEEWRHFVEAGGDSEQGKRELGRLHEAARARMRAAAVPRLEALEPILAALLENVDYRV